MDFFEHFALLDSKGFSGLSQNLLFAEKARSAPEAVMIKEQIFGYAALFSGRHLRVATKMYHAAALSDGGFVGQQSV